MALRTILGACAVVAIAAAAALLVVAHGDHGNVATYDANSAVITLTEDTFDEHLEAHPTGFIEFFAPWCGHCKTLQPIFSQAAEQGKAEGIVFAAFDASNGGSIGSRYGIQGFPTIKYFKNGEALDYDGDRAAQAFIDFARKMNADPITNVESSADVEAFTATHPFTIVGQFAAADETARATFRAAAGKLFLRFSFVEVTAPAAATEIRTKVEGITDDAVYAGDVSDVAALSAWVEANCVPLIDELNGKTWKSRVVESQVGSFVVFIDPAASAEEAARVKAIMTTAAQTFRGRSTWFTADGVALSRFADSINAGGAMPRLAVIQPAKDDTKFAMSGEFTLENVIQFVEDFLSEKLVRVYKSAEPPAVQDGPVFILTQKTFDQEVLETPKNVFVEFYAPWCGHCKALAPVWDQLGEHFKSRDDIRIAKIDMDANELSGKYGIRGFPTLLWFGAGDKAKFANYNGGRTLDDLIKYVEEQAGLDVDAEGEL